MTNNEIKKLIYKENPIARLTHIHNSEAVYMTLTDEDLEESFFFHVPVSEMGDALFASRIEAKYLLRWLTN